MGADHSELSARLAEVVGAANVLRGTRDLAQVGVSAPAPGDAPTFVVRPGAAAEIAELMRLAAGAGAAVVPVGTATRASHHLSRSEPKETARGGGQGPGVAGRARLVVDMKRMCHVLHLDETSLVLHAQTGPTGLALEELLLPRGLSLGDFPPAALRSTLGGLLAVRTPGKSSPRHGFLEDAVLGVSAVLADGRMIHTRVAPRRATGPDLGRALLGSEGTLGILTSAVIKIHRRPETRLLDAHLMPSIEAATAAIHATLRKDARPAAVRVYDAAEAAAHLGEGHASGEQAILVAATAGPTELATVERTILAEAAKQQGGSPLGTSLAELWWRRRTGHTLPGPPPPSPALQIAASPGRIGRVYRAAIAAAAVADRSARAHVSRFDDDGACLFVTLLHDSRPDPNGPARAAVEHAARLAGGLLIGERDTALEPYFAGLKQALDPQGILNPGVLSQATGRPS